MTALLLGSCSRKGSNTAAVFAKRPYSKRACVSLGPFEEGFYDRKGYLHYVVPSDNWVTIQMDSAYGAIPPEHLFATHPCLEKNAGVRSLERGFCTYRLERGWAFQTAFAELWPDTTINRVIPVYVDLSDDSDYPVTDIIEMEVDGFRRPTWIIVSVGLLFVSRDDDRGDVYYLRIPDYDKGSPFACSTVLSREAGVVWSAPKRYTLNEQPDSQTTVTAVAIPPDMQLSR